MDPAQIRSLQQSGTAAYNLGRLKGEKMYRDGQSHDSAASHSPWAGQGWIDAQRKQQNYQNEQRKAEEHERRVQNYISSQPRHYSQPMTPDEIMKRENERIRLKEEARKDLIQDTKDIALFTGVVGSLLYGVSAIKADGINAFYNATNWLYSDRVFPIWNFVSDPYTLAASAVISAAVGVVLLPEEKSDAQKIEVKTVSTVSDKAPNNIPESKQRDATRNRNASRAFKLGATLLGLSVVSAATDRFIDLPAPEPKAGQHAEPAPEPKAKNVIDKAQRNKQIDRSDATVLLVTVDENRVCHVDKMNEDQPLKDTIVLVGEDNELRRLQYNSDDISTTFVGKTSTIDDFYDPEKPLLPETQRVKTDNISPIAEFTFEYMEKNGNSTEPATFTCIPLPRNDDITSGREATFLNRDMGR